MCSVTYIHTLLKLHVNLTNNILILTPSSTAECYSNAYFTCGNNNCVARNQVCDGEDDCGDNTDEEQTCGILNPLLYYFTSFFFFFSLFFFRGVINDLSFLGPKVRRLFEIATKITFFSRFCLWRYGNKL